MASSSATACARSAAIPPCSACCWGSCTSSRRSRSSWWDAPIDRYPLKRIFVFIVLCQIPLFVLAIFATGWMFYALAIGFMAFVFGAIPFTDALIVRYVDDRMRSRVAGVRFAIAFGVSAAAVWLLGPLVKANGFGFLLALMAGIAAVSAVAITRLPPPPAPAARS